MILRTATGTCAIMIASCLVGCHAPLGQDAPASHRLSIPLRVDVPPGVDQGQWPLTFGVPFPRDTLAAGTPVTVLANGRPIPTQAAPLATWTKDGSHVRWLLVDSQVDAASAPTTAYSLEIGANGRTPKTSLELRRDGDRVVIDTGAARFVVRDRGGLAVESVRIGRRDVVSPRRPMRFTIKDHNDRTYVATGNLLAGGALIEDQGPCRISLKSEGWYEAADGSRFCQHVTRLQFFAGLPSLRLLHTFIFTEKTEDAQVHDLAVEIPLSTGGEKRAVFGIDARDFARVHEVDGREHVSLVQDHRTRWDLSWDLGDRTADHTLAEGDRAGGWADLSGPEGGATIAIRDAWQNYPNELEVTSDTLIAHLWPRHGRRLDFSTRAVLAPYGKKGIEALDAFFLSRRKPYTKSLDQIDNNAMGVAKTHELWVDFHAEPFDPGRAARIAQQANTPVLGTADPKWNCASGAMLEPIHPYDPETFPHAESMLEAMFDRFTYWQEHFADYGWFDFGDVHNDARGQGYGIEVEGGQSAMPWRSWDSTHYGLPNGPWTLYFRSGQRKYLAFAESNARHCMDIDRCHFGDGTKRIRGTHYYCDWSIIPWNGVPPTYVMLANYDKLEYLLWAYYLRGDRRGLDVMCEWGEAMKRFHDDPKVNFPLRMLAPNYKNVRHFGPPLGNLTELYRATWDPQYLRIAGDYARALMTMFPDEETFGQHLGELQFCWEGMANYARTSGDEQFTRTVVRYAEGSARRGGHRHSFGGPGFGFGLTGDTALLDLGKANLARLLAQVYVGEDPAFRGTGGYWTCGDHPYSIRSLPVLLGAMASAPISWRRENLPLLQTNRTAHFAGPRLPDLVVVPDGTGDPITLALRLGLKQAVRLGDRTIERPSDSLVLLGEPDLGPGETRLTFPLRPTRHEGDYIDRGNADLVVARGLKIAILPSTEEGHFCLFGPRFYFFVPPEVQRVQVEVQTAETWAVYGWKPIVHLFDPDGKAVDTGEGPGAFELEAEAGPSQRGALWSLGPLGRVSAPRENATWNKPMRDPAAHFPAFFRLPRDVPKVVSPHPDLFFLPSDRGGPASQSGATLP